VTAEFNAIGLTVGLILVNAFVFISMDKWVQDRSDSIASGMIRGVPVSIKHRRYLLQTRFLIHGPTLITIEGLLVAAWVFAGQHATVEELRLLAYLAAFVNATGAVGWTLLFPFWYFHLASLLRETGAD